MNNATAALGLFVLVILPPLHKWKDPTQRVYWQVQLKDEAGATHGNTYRVTDRDKAKLLAHKIAEDRKIPIITAESQEITDAPKGSIWLDQGDLHDITSEEALSFFEEPLPF